MATTNVYAGKFVGNDFIIPRLTKPKIIEPIHKITLNRAPEPAPVEPIAETITEPVAATVPESIAEPVDITVPELVEVPKASSLSRHRSRTKVLLLVSALVVFAVGVPVLLKTDTLHVLSSKTSRLVNYVRKDIHGTPAFSMPRYSVLVHSSDLSTDLDDIEVQAITVNLGTTVVTPQPSDIAQWVKSSAGPQAGTTLLSVNTASLSAYLTGVAQNNSRQATQNVSGISYGGISAATNQIANILLSCNGTSVTLPSTVIPSQTDSSFGLSQ
jgi:hypothetical protein